MIHKQHLLLPRLWRSLGAYYYPKRGLEVVEVVARHPIRLEENGSRPIFREAWLTCEANVELRSADNIRGPRIVAVGRLRESSGEALTFKRHSR